jgi:hypothetical protein
MVSSALAGWVIARYVGCWVPLRVNRREDRFRVGGPGADRCAVADHVVVVVGDRLPVDRA